jgi:acyl-CoA reductase-like NAD-dependent aldehyde dehydrogenase
MAHRLTSGITYAAAGHDMNLNDTPPQLLIPADFEQCLARQRIAYLTEPNPSHAQRVADLKTLARMLKENQAALVDAIHRDYGNRSHFETLFAEFFVVLDGIRETAAKLKRWMKPQKRHVDQMMYPLAKVYPFTHDKALQRMLVERVMSGGVSINEAMMHAAQHDLPFAGVGASGMGHYHGYEGFCTFSKLRPVFHQAPFSAIQMMFQPPYGARAAKIMDWLIRLRG